VRLGLGDEEGYPRKGHIAFVDNGLDPSSGTIRVRAVFDNTDGRLLPGLYARIHVGSGAARPAVLVDEAAIGTDQDKRFVLVLDEHNKTAYRQVTLGASQAGRRVIEQGLTPGERIVVSGLQHVRPGDPVSPRPALASAAATSSPS
jgi:multidrug efflux system membrane fusion protein